MTLSQEVLIVVTPAKAGAQNFFKSLDSGFRRNDRRDHFLTFYEPIKFGI